MADEEQSGHRKRLKERFLTGDPAARSDERLLELLLTFAVARKDTRPLAQELIRVFGNLSETLSASEDELSRIIGLGPSSVALLKVVNYIQSKTDSLEKRSLLNRTGPTQQKLFEDPTDTQNNWQKEPDIPSIQSEPNQMGTKIAHRLKHPFSKKTSSPKKIDQRKFQVSNGYILDFDQLARVMHFLLEHRAAKRINRKALQEDTGLAGRQVESLVSMGSAMGLIRPGIQILTPTGLLIAEHDLFFKKQGTLEWCHYKGAGSYQNLIWFEAFNRLLVEETATNQQGWQDYFREKLLIQYTTKTIKNHLPKETRFVIDAYTERNFNMLALLQRTPDDLLYRRRYARFDPLILSAIIYDFCATKKTQLYQVTEFASTQGSPAMVFGLDAASFRQHIEGLHDHGWLRYETTHNLDQVRLKPGFDSIEFLTAFYKSREPHQNDKIGME